jgi:adenylate cyclase class IV
MNRNIEIKARVEDLASLEELVRDLAGEGPTVLHQEDSFFRVGSGRLKLRRLSESEGELIFYTRPDCAMPAESRYTVVPTAVPDDLLGILSQALGVRGVVRKHRSLYRI